MGFLAQMINSGAFKVEEAPENEVKKNLVFFSYRFVFVTDEKTFYIDVYDKEFALEPDKVRTINVQGCREDFADLEVTFHTLWADWLNKVAYCIINGLIDRKRAEELYTIYMQKYLEALRSIDFTKHNVDMNYKAVNYFRSIPVGYDVIKEYPRTKTWIDKLRELPKDSGFTIL